MSGTAVETDFIEGVLSSSEKDAGVVAPSLIGQCLAEFIGTFIVILVGDGAVAVAVLTSGIDGWGVDCWGLDCWGLGAAVTGGSPEILASAATFTPKTRTATMDREKQMQRTVDTANMVAVRRAGEQPPAAAALRADHWDRPAASPLTSSVWEPRRRR